MNARAGSRVKKIAFRFVSLRRPVCELRPFKDLTRSVLADASQRALPTIRAFAGSMTARGQAIVLSSGQLM